MLGNPPDALSLVEPRPDAPAQVSDTGLVVPVRVTPNAAPAVECGGRDGPEPTRFGDWERAGRCIDC